VFLILDAYYLSHFHCGRASLCSKVCGNVSGCMYFLNKRCEVHMSEFVVSSVGRRNVDQYIVYDRLQMLGKRKMRFGEKKF
jgi:hypothetical protein